MGKSREYNKRSCKAYLQRIRLKVLNAYGLKCGCCNERHIEFLAIDHINGKGLKHRKANGFTNSRQFYQWLIKNNFPLEFRILCHNCNNANGFYGYCPHLI